jgi:small subunit ribosomal protein S3
LGQKTNPVGYRLGFIKTWNSQWFDEKDFSKKLNEDLLIRRYIKKRMADGAVSRVEIERTAKRILVTIHTARPGVVIGKKGAEVDQL